MSDINLSNSRSALRYRMSGEAEPGIRRASIPRASRARAHQVRTTASWPDDEDEGSRPFTHTGAVSGSRGAEQGRRHTVILLGVGMLVALTLSIVSMRVFAWGASELNTLRYGYPRTFQIDAVVGHQDSASSPSHFLAINLRGHIEVVEWPGGDAAHARIYVGPQLFGQDSDQQPVTLRFADVNGDHLPDIIIEVQGSQIVFINDQGSFRPLKPGEQYSLPG